MQLLEYVFPGLLSTVDEFDLRLNIENEMRPKPNFKILKECVNVSYKSGLHASCNLTEVSVEVCGHSDAGTLYERIRLEKLPYVHRAVSITMDSKGRNFGVLQSDPKTR